MQIDEITPQNPSQNVCYRLTDGGEPFADLSLQFSGISEPHYLMFELYQTPSFGQIKKLLKLRKLLDEKLFCNVPVTETIAVKFAQVFGFTIQETIGGYHYMEN